MLAVSDSVSTMKSVCIRRYLKLSCSGCKFVCVCVCVNRAILVGYSLSFGYEHGAFSV